MVTSDSHQYLTGAIFATLTADEEIVSQDEFAECKAPDHENGEGQTAALELTITPASQTVPADGDIPSRLPSLRVSSLSGTSSTDDSFNTESALSALGYAPIVASYKPNVDPLKSSSKTLAVSVEVMEAADSPDLEVGPHVLSSVSGAEEDLLEVSVPSATSIILSLRKAATRMEPASSLMEETETPRWISARSNEVAWDYFNFRDKATSVAGRGTCNTTEELVGAMPKERAGQQAKHRRGLSCTAKFSPGMSSSCSLGVGFDQDGSGPGFRWLVPPVGAARPVRHHVFASSVSTQACNAFGLSSESILGFSDFAGFASQRTISMQPHESGQRPALRAMNSTLDCLEPPSPMEPLPSPEIGRGKA